MTFSCRYFADGSQYGQKDFSKFMYDAFDDGYVTGVGNELKCSCDGSNMTVSIATGRGYIQGYSFDITDSPESLTIPTADTTYDRIDRIVARLSPDANKNITLAVLQGTASATPQPTALTRTDATWEISLAKVLVPHGSSFIPAGSVTDEREDRTVCGRANEKLIAGERIASGTVAGDRVQHGSSTNYGVYKIGYGLEVHNDILQVTGGELKGNFVATPSALYPYVTLTAYPKASINVAGHTPGAYETHTFDLTITPVTERTIPYMLHDMEITVSVKIGSAFKVGDTIITGTGTVDFTKDGAIIDSHTFESSTSQYYTFTFTGTVDELTAHTWKISGTVSVTNPNGKDQCTVTNNSTTVEYKYLQFTA